MAIEFEISQYIEDKLQEFINSTDEDKLDIRSIAAMLNALPLYLDMGEGYAIRPSGEIVGFEWDNEENFQIERDARIRNIALNQGSKKFPELKRLIPPRSINDLDCSGCNGTGIPVIFSQLGMDEVVKGGIVCYCGGLRWIPKT
jgi:hypothetical protein